MNRSAPALRLAAFGLALRRAVAALLLTSTALLAASPAAAQVSSSAGNPETADPSSPYGATGVPTPELMWSQPAGAASRAPAGATPQQRNGLPPVPPLPAASAPLRMPPDPATALTPIVFGSQIFVGRFGVSPYTGFNPEYQIAVGDRINVRMWGAFSFEATQQVDAQGNVFVPNIGPVRVLGVRNADLNDQFSAQVKRVFRNNVGVYATLAAAQPVKVYVTGFVRAPGLYGGLSSDSVLYYLDKAGGIDPDRGSYLEVDVLRGGKLRAKFNLYSFLLDGHIEHVQLQDGDTIVAHPRKFTVQVGGEVLNPYIFEFGSERVPASQVLAVARPKPGATHISIARQVGLERRSEYHPLSALSGVSVENGDEVLVTSDKYPGTLLVRIDGAHLGPRTLVLPYGARLRDAIAQMQPAPQANVAAVQLFRRSVAQRQKEMLDASLRNLETYALTARSATSEEANLRTREAELILKFIERARMVQPKGQVLLAQREEAGNTLLEDGDVIKVPEQSNLVLVSGEVILPNALVYDPRASVEDYIRRSGGYTQGANEARVLVLRQDGSVVENTRQLMPGDEILVMPKIQTKSIEIARGLTQILYQIAIAAKVALDL